MNTNQFNTEVYDATPYFFSANGISILGFGELIASMGVPVDSIFKSTNYITRVFPNVNYIKGDFISTNYIEPIVSNTNYVKG